MKIVPNRRLFWFLKEGRRLDLNDPASLDLYVQQILSRGRWEDVKSLLNEVEPRPFRTSFQRIKNFLPVEVRNFWEDFLGNYHAPSAAHP